MTEINKQNTGSWLNPEYDEGLVSVIVPNYNRANLICETLDSVFAQTYRPIELIVVDDGSTDDSIDVIRQWAKSQREDDGFEFRLIQQENHGAPTARNRGEAESKGEYIQFWDSDDVMYPEKLEMQISAMKASSVQWSGCLIDGGFCNPDLLPQLTPSNNVVWGALCTPTGLYCRKLVNKVGKWNPDLEIMQDTEFCFRVLCAEPDGVWVPKVLGSIRSVDLGIMRLPVQIKAYRALHTIEAIEQYAKKMGTYDPELRENFGKMLFYYYRRLAKMNHLDANLYFGKSKERCAGRSMHLLRFFRVIHWMRLLPLIPEKYL